MLWHNSRIVRSIKKQATPSDWLRSCLTLGSHLVIMNDTYALAYRSSISDVHKKIRFLNPLSPVHMRLSLSLSLSPHKINP